MLVTAMNYDQDVSGTQKQVLDTDHDSGNSDSIRFAGQVKFHSSQLLQLLPMEAAVFMRLVPERLR